MENADGKLVDLYIPRKCSWTNRLIAAKEFGAVQVAVGIVDPVTGRYTGETKSFAISGYVRDKGESDMALTSLVEKFDRQKADADAGTAGAAGMVFGE